ncbi:MAG: LiaF domain-containing protein [Syntrophomonadaceae bacterium]|jgi:predicted membrane protein
MSGSNGRYLTGLVIIAAGIIALLNNFGIIRVSFTYLVSLAWPFLLAMVGIIFMVNRRGLVGMVAGGILFVLGVMYLGRNAGFFTIDMAFLWRILWPAILILIGVSLLSKTGRHNSGHLAIMGAVEKNKDGWELESGEYTAVLGAVELDLRNATFKEKEISLDLTAVMGGITLTVPEDVTVTCKATSVLGGVDLLGKEMGGIVGNTSLKAGDLQTAARILHLDCTCVLGGIEIKR